MPPKRILIFSTAYLPFIGGAEIAVKEITDRLPQTEFVMVTARMDQKLPTRERIGRVEVHRIGKGNAGDKYRLMLSGPRYAASLGMFDAVWAIMASYAGFAALRYKKQHPNTRFVLTLQEGDSRWDIYKHVWWCWSYFTQIFRRADRIQAISTYLADWARTLGARGHVSVIPNGVDANRFLPRVPKGKTIVSVSRLVKKNGIDVLLRACALLPADTQLILAGGGEEERGLRRLAAELGAASRVQFLGGVPPEQIPNILSGAVVFCRPSRSEGLGNAFLEAMAAGVPVVGTAVGGILDFLTDGETGLVARVDDAKDIAEKIQRILSDAALAKKLSDNGRALVAENYQWDAIAVRMSEILQCV